MVIARADRSQKIVISQSSQITSDTSATGSPQKSSRLPCRQSSKWTPQKVTLRLLRPPTSTQHNQPPPTRHRHLMIIEQYLFIFRWSLFLQMPVSGLLDVHHLGSSLPLPRWHFASNWWTIVINRQLGLSPFFTVILRSMCSHYRLNEVPCPISACFSLLSQDIYLKKLFCSCEMQKSCWYGPSPGLKAHKYPRKSLNLGTSRPAKRGDHEGFLAYLRSLLFLWPY
jgi:hypothetical protein